MEWLALLCSFVTLHFEFEIVLKLYNHKAWFLYNILSLLGEKFLHCHNCMSEAFHFYSSFFLLILIDFKIVPLVLKIEKDA